MKKSMSTNTRGNNGKTLKKVSKPPQTLKDNDNDDSDPITPTLPPSSKTTTVQSEGHKLPMGNAWATLGPVLAPETLQVITENFGFTHLTAVQSATIPAFLSNKDVCVQAVTGSGKTLAFVVPMIEMLTTLRSPLEKHHIGAMIITPTRELAQQIHTIVEKFTSAVPLLHQPTTFLTPPAICIGGKNPEMELHFLKSQGVNVIIGTPGRLDQVLSTKFLFDSSKLELLILDEADRLLEAGFQIHLTSIMKKIPKQRRTGLFSATLTTQIQELAKIGLRNPVDITLKVRYNDEKEKLSSSGPQPQSQSQPQPQQLPNDQDESGSQLEHDSINDLLDGPITPASTRHQAIPSTLTNYFQIIQPEHKILHLVQFLLEHPDQNIIIFFLTCAEVDYFYRVLASFPPLAVLFSPFNNEMIDTVGLQHIANPPNQPNKNPKSLFCALHGQMNQSKRSRTLEAFKKQTNTYNAETFPKTDSSPSSPSPSRRLGSVLLCTDVAARGVDVNHIDWVIQMDPPQQPDVFIHRIGRSARAGQRGQALTFLLETERAFVDMMLAKFVPFVDYRPVQLTKYNNMMNALVNGGEYDIPKVREVWDKICWNPAEEIYFQLEKKDHNDDNDDNDDKNDKNDKLVSLQNPTSPASTKITLPSLPSCSQFKSIIPYNVYKVIVDKKEDRRGFKNETKKQTQIEHVAFKKQENIQKEQQERQAQLPPYTNVVLQYPTIPFIHNNGKNNNSKQFNQTEFLKTISTNPFIVSTSLVPYFIPHCRYAISYDRYLFELCQKSYVSHINGYKEHMAKFIFPFDRLLFIHVAIGFGMLFLPQLADLKKYALIWPHLTRLLPRMITQYHNQQIEEIKTVENDKKKMISLKQIEKRKENEKNKQKEMEFKQQQRQKKNKTRAKTTYEEVRKEWEELGDELRDMKKKQKLSKKNRI
jgi:ATP-dependent RNA helicase DDX55/SPB4